MKNLRLVRMLFGVVLLTTLVSLLTPGDQVLAAKQWVASWLPFAAQLDAADVTHHTDKVVHALLFAGLGYLAARGWVQRRQLAWVLLGLLWLAPQTEWLQAHIPGRGASWGDVLADVLGLALGVFWALVLRWRKRSAAAQQPSGEWLGQSAPVANSGKQCVGFKSADALGDRAT